MSSFLITASLSLFMGALTFAQTPRPLANLQLKYKVGQRVGYIENGFWLKAVVTDVRDGSALLRGLFG